MKCEPRNKDAIKANTLKAVRILLETSEQIDEITRHDLDSNVRDMLENVAMFMFDVATEIYPDTDRFSRTIKYDKKVLDGLAIEALNKAADSLFEVYDDNITMLREWRESKVCAILETVLQVMYEHLDKIED